MKDYSVQLSSGIKALNLSIDPIIQEKMLKFLNLLQKWNQTYNLTAIDEISQMIDLHLLDSLTIANYLKGTRILDAGTGAGFPGLPLALCFPDKQFTLLDSNGKKIRFLLQAKTTLQIENIDPVQARLEDYQPKRCFDAVMARALGHIPDIIKQAEHLCCPEGQYLLMKGIDPQSEVKELKKKWTIHQLNIPGMVANRHLVVVDNSALN